jgi:hypothetical protein
VGVIIGLMENGGWVRWEKDKKEGVWGFRQQGWGLGRGKGV